MQHLKDAGCKIYLGGEAVVQVTGGQVRLPFVCGTCTYLLRMRGGESELDIQPVRFEGSCFSSSK